MPLREGYTLGCVKARKRERLYLHVLWVQAGADCHADHGDGLRARPGQALPPSIRVTASEEVAIVKGKIARECNSEEGTRESGGNNDCVCVHAGLGWGMLLMRAEKEEIARQRRRGREVLNVFFVGCMGWGGGRLCGRCRRRSTTPSVR